MGCALVRLRIPIVEFPTLSLSLSRTRLSHFRLFRNTKKMHSFNKRATLDLLKRLPKVTILKVSVEQVPDHWSGYTDICNFMDDLVSVPSLRKSLVYLQIGKKFQSKDAEFAEEFYSKHVFFHNSFKLSHDLWKSSRLPTKKLYSLRYVFNKSPGKFLFYMHWRDTLFCCTCVTCPPSYVFGSLLFCLVYCMR